MSDRTNQRLPGITGPKRLGRLKDKYLVPTLKAVLLHGFGVDLNSQSSTQDAEPCWRRRM